MVTGLAGPGSVAGGVWEVVVNQSQALLDAGYEVSIAAGWLGTSPPSQIRGLPVELVPVRPPVKQFGLRWLMGRGWKAAVQRAATGADIAHLHLCRDHLTTSATRTLKQLGLPTVAQTHGMLRPASSPLFAAFDMAITGPALRRIGHFVALTDAEKPALHSFGVPTDQMTIIENSVPDHQRAWRPDEAPLRLLFVSRLHPRKQVLVFAEVVAQLRAAGLDVEGVVAGPDQGDLPRLLSFIKSGGHQEYLSYIGEIDRLQLVDELARATALVFPARQEPFGLVLIEAMAVGTPVITTDETPLASIISSSAAALVTPPRTDTFASAIGRLVQDADLRAALSRNGRALYESSWTNEIMVKHLIDLYARELDPASAS